MKNKSTLSIVAIVLGVFFILAIIAFQFVSSYHNTANQYEQTIKMLSKQSESQLSNYSTQIVEMAQVGDKYKNDLIEIVKANLQGRYGEDGSKAITQFMNEQNLQVDPKIYLNMQNAITAGRTEFKISQDKITAACRDYEISLGNFFGGMMLRMQGFPKIDMKHYCEIVSDAQTKQTFETKEQKPVKF